MKLFDVVTMTTVKDRRTDENGKLRSEMTYRAPKGQIFALLLFACPTFAEAEKVDVDAVLRDIFIGNGWTPPPDEKPPPG